MVAANAAGIKPPTATKVFFSLFLWGEGGGGGGVGFKGLGFRAQLILIGFKPFIIQKQALNPLSPRATSTALLSKALSPHLRLCSPTPCSVSFRRMSELEE